MVLKESDNEKK